eukprot:CAMPEP_0172312804 /NCGR_PEP_ID=MMETSP1058-20130122/18569_1 /TAXON_ID=83371 /ORGANISM="Detonula confervacea, Strain CCMP 353" /LENGTH=183 /DNA_ID=CAMNT_0013026349 /DNA_START=11 /DNA_END=562 /DNA_ORIENTATION=+
MTFDSNKSTPAKRRGVLIAKCPRQKKLKIRLTPRKQSLRPKQKQSPPPSSSSPRCPSKLVGDELILQLRALKDFHLSTEYSFSTPRSSHHPRIISNNTSIIVPFPNLVFPNTPDGNTELLQPCMTLKPKTRPRILFPNSSEASFIEQVLTYKEHMNISSSSDEYMISPQSPFMFTPPRTPSNN